jgi:hypothetical protein
LCLTAILMYSICHRDIFPPPLDYQQSEYYNYELQCSRSISVAGCTSSDVTLFYSCYTSVGQTLISLLLVCTWSSGSISGVGVDFRFDVDGDASCLGWRPGRGEFGNPCGEYGWIQTTVHLLFHAGFLIGISGWCVYSFCLHITIIRIHTSKSVWWQLCNVSCNKISTAEKTFFSYEVKVSQWLKCRGVK